MTMNEFTAWLEGYEESFTNKMPNKEQWKRIKAKMEDIYVPIQTYSYPYTYTIPYTYTTNDCAGLSTPTSITTTATNVVMASENYKNSSSLQ